ncbi:hypothetical protein N0824_00855 [Microcystis sp. 0824]|nr:hypothetical protein N0824_00855 [Microcystis sp. 0824]
MIAAVVLQNRDMESTISYFAPYSSIIASLTIYLTAQLNLLKLT